ncbi:MAG: phage major capsid protein, P2 family [Cycloclasticus sp.]|jgi:phage major capsid protein, P2 family
MQTNTLKAFNAYLDTVAKAFGIHSSIVKNAKSFVATPSVEQNLKKAIQANSTFLSKINYRTRQQTTGAKIGLSLSGPGATTVDTAGGGTRTPKKLHSLSDDQYEMKKVNFDTLTTYEDLDEWAEFKEFKTLIQQLITEMIINNQVMIGWYGEAWVGDSNPATNPLLQDVNVGWFQKIRDNAPAQLLSEGANAGEIRFGPGGDFENIDVIVETVKSGIPVHKRKNKKMVVLIGEDLLAAQRIELYKAHGNTPTEKQIAEVDKITRQFGGLPLFEEAYFPGRGILITPLENLGLYTQKGSVRRRIVDNPSKDQVENYTSMNQAYVIEDYESVAGIEFKNVKLPVPTSVDASGWL